MPYERTLDVLPPAGPACAFLRSKGMYVTGQSEPDAADETGVHHFWCMQTQHVIGPDSAGVDRRACVAGRGCFSLTR
jgi:hypothetical protein